LFGVFFLATSKKNCNFEKTKKMTNMKRLLPYGSANFEEIATGNFYYIDKTLIMYNKDNI